MLDNSVIFWFNIAQNVGSVATAIALAFLAYQSHLTRKQVQLLEKEMDINLRPWIYRIQDTRLDLTKSEDLQQSLLQQDVQLDYAWDSVEDYVTLSFWISNFGKLAPNSLKKYSILTDTEIKDVEIIKSGFNEELKVKIFPNQKYRFEHYIVHYQTHRRLTNDLEIVKNFFQKPIHYFGASIEYEYNTRIGKKIGKYVVVFSIKPWYHYNGEKPLDINLEEEWGE